MARSEQVLSIFLASPGDVPEERKRVKDVVDTWNLSWSREFSIRLELLQWETDSYPDAGLDGQDVINRQIPSDWDLFIGLMWVRFGTPTGRAGSGTEEEFLRALERKRESDSKIGLLLYFKDGPLAPSKIDPTQLAKVLDFQKQVRSQGLLTWNFIDADDFERQLSLHLTKHVQEWRRSIAVALPQSPHSGELERVAATPPRAGHEQRDRGTVVPSGDCEDDGYLDLHEEFARRSAEINDITARINAAQSNLTEKTNAGRIEIERLASSPGEATASAFRAAISGVADEMMAYTALLDEEMPRFRLAMDKSMAVLMKLLNISAELFPEQRKEAKASAFVLLRTLTDSRLAIQGFRESTISLPRMTKELNVAKRRQAEALGVLVAEFERAERLLAEGIEAIGL